VSNDAVQSVFSADAQH